MEVKNEIKKIIRIIVYWLINILILIILIKPYIIYLRNEFFVVYSVIAQAGSSFLFYFHHFYNI